MKVPFNLYLNRAKEVGIIPNFFVSEPYLKLSDVQCFIETNWIWIEDEEWLLFPPLCLTKNEHRCPFIGRLKNVWSDFESLSFDHLATRKFLDWEYIFNPIHFNDLSGGKWETYRKNIRKWPKSHAKWFYSSYFKRKELCIFLSDWLETKGDKTEDGNLLLDYIINDNLLVHRRFIYDELDELVAVNAWDENWKYINYRYCIVKKDNLYLDEFARYLFYTDPIIQAKGKLVNDGGCLGYEGLEHFKNKLNPVKKRAVYSWIKF